MSRLAKKRETCGHSRGFASHLLSAPIDEQGENDLKVTGQPCYVERNDALALAFERGEYFIKHHEELVDRYDARLLLDYLPGNSALRLLEKDQDLEHERYYVLSTLKDLLQLLGVSDLNRIHDLDGFLVYVDETVKRRKGGEYSMVDFSYSVETKGEAFNSEMGEDSATQAKSRSQNSSMASFDDSYEKTVLRRTYDFLLQHSAFEATPPRFAKELLAELRKQTKSYPIFSFLNSIEDLQGAFTSVPKDSKWNSKPERSAETAKATLSSLLDYGSDSPSSGDESSLPPADIQPSTGTSDVTAESFVHPADKLNEKIETPPSEIKVVIDKLAVMVRKNGIVFERKVKEEQANNPRFDFLKPWDTYHAYYQMRVLQEASRLKRELG